MTLQIIFQENLLIYFLKKVKVGITKKYILINLLIVLKCHSYPENVATFFPFFIQSFQDRFKEEPKDERQKSTASNGSECKLDSRDQDSVEIKEQRMNSIGIATELPNIVVTATTVVYCVMQYTLTCIFDRNKGVEALTSIHDGATNFVAGGFDYIKAAYEEVKHIVCSQTYYNIKQEQKQSFNPPGDIQISTKTENSPSLSIYPCPTGIKFDFMLNGTMPASCRKLDWYCEEFAERCHQAYMRGYEMANHFEIAFKYGQPYVDHNGLWHGFIDTSEGICKMFCIKGNKLQEFTARLENQGQTYGDFEPTTNEDHKLRMLNIKGDNPPTQTEYIWTFTRDDRYTRNAWCNGLPGNWAVLDPDTAQIVALINLDGQVIKNDLPCSPYKYNRKVLMYQKDRWKDARGRRFAMYDGCLDVCDQRGDYVCALNPSGQIININQQKLIPPVEYGPYEYLGMPTYTDDEGNTWTRLIYKNEQKPNQNFTTNWGIMDKTGKLIYTADEFGNKIEIDYNTPPSENKPSDDETKTQGDSEEKKAPTKKSSRSSSSGSSSGGGGCTGGSGGKNNNDKNSKTKSDCCKKNNEELQQKVKNLEKELNNQKNLHKKELNKQKAMHKKEFNSLKKEVKSIKREVRENKGEIANQKQERHAYEQRTNAELRKVDQKITSLDQNQKSLFINVEELKKAMAGFAAIQLNANSWFSYLLQFFKNSAEAVNNNEFVKIINAYDSVKSFKEKGEWIKDKSIELCQKNDDSPASSKEKKPEQEQIDPKAGLIKSPTTFGEPELLWEKTSKLKQVEENSFYSDASKGLWIGKNAKSHGYWTRKPKDSDKTETISIIGEVEKQD